MSANLIPSSATPWLLRLHYDVEDYAFELSPVQLEWLHKRVGAHAALLSDVLEWQTGDELLTRH